MKIIKNTVKTIRFQRLDDDGDPITTAPDEIVVEVKKDDHATAKIVKKLSNGEILWNSSDLSWFFTFETSDTDGLPLGAYGLHIYETIGSSVTSVYDTEVRIVELYSDPGDDKKHPSPSASINLYQAAVRADDDSDKRGIFCGTVTNGSLFPTHRPDGTPLNNEDYVRPDALSTFPFDVEGCTFTSVRDKAYYINGSWHLDAGALQDTAETPTLDKTVESLSGGATTQKAVNVENKNAITDVREDIVDLGNAKVDKDFAHGDIVYSVINGHVANQAISKYATQNTVAWRDAGGTLRVGTPTENTHAATKKYVDDSMSTKQNKLTAGNNITIENDGTISAKDTTYTDGENIEITSDNVISATDTITYVVDNLTSVDPYKALSANQGRILAEGMQGKLTAGNNITISSSNVISADKTAVVDNLLSTETSKALSANQGRILETTKQDKLPTAVKNKFLHSNAATGDLEWEVASGSGAHYVETLPTIGEDEGIYVVGGYAEYKPGGKADKPASSQPDTYFKMSAQIVAWGGVYDQVEQTLSYTYSGTNCIVPIAIMDYQEFDVLEPTTSTDPDAFCKWDQALNRMVPLAGTEITDIYLKLAADCNVIDVDIDGGVITFEYDDGGTMAREALTWRTLCDGEDLFSMAMMGYMVPCSKNDAHFHVLADKYSTASGHNPVTESTSYATVCGVKSYRDKYIYANNNYIDISGKEFVKQYNVMPEAIASKAGKIVEYVGPTDSDFKHGYFYECVAAATIGEYEWENIQVQDGNIKTVTINYGTDSYDTTLEKAQNTDMMMFILDGDELMIVGHYTHYTTSHKLYFYASGGDRVYCYWVEQATNTWQKSNTKYETQDNRRTVVNKSSDHFTYPTAAAVYDAVKNKMTEYGTMPTPSSDYLGSVVEYTGTTTATYKHGYFYECVADTTTTPTSYQWVHIETQLSDYITRVMMGQTRASIWNLRTEFMDEKGHMAYGPVKFTGGDESPTGEDTDLSNYMVDIYVIEKSENGWGCIIATNEYGRWICKVGIGGPGHSGEVSNWERFMTTGDMWQYMPRIVSTDASYTQAIGASEYDKGASLTLRGKDNPDTDDGNFELKATNGSDSVYLIGKSDGTLTWNNNRVLDERDIEYTTGVLTDMTRSTMWDKRSIFADTKGHMGFGPVKFAGGSESPSGASTDPTNYTVDVYVMDNTENGWGCMIATSEYGRWICKVGVGGAGHSGEVSAWEKYTTSVDLATKQNKITVSTSAPSGGSNGDIWLQVA